MRKSKSELISPLLKRIETGGGVGMSHSHWIDEIGESLSILFNTHMGSAAIDHEYGLAEFQPDEISGSVRLTKKASEITQLIQRFEPRLKQVRVEARVDDEYVGRIVFEVQGILDESLSGGRVSYHTVMTANGRVWLRK